MKKILFATGLFVAFTTVVSAQTSTTDQTALRVTLDHAMSIVVGQEQVTLTLATVDNFATGVSSTQSGHLRISSSSNFEVKVNTSGANLVGEGSTSNTMAAGLISVLPTAGDGEIATQATLSTGQASILQGVSGLNKNYNVTYAISAANAQTLFNKAEDTYQTTVTYEIMPR